MSETLDDVIVTGYATIDRGSYVGAVTQIRAEDIQVAGEATIDQMLQGVIPGMSVVNRTGKVGRISQKSVFGELQRCWETKNRFGWLTG